MNSKPETPGPVFRNLATETDKPWIRLAGGLRHLHKETVRIDKLIDDEFGKIDPEEWK